MRARTRAWGVAPALLLALATASVALSAAAVAAAPAGSSDATWSLRDIRTARALIAHVPAAVRPSCTMDDLHAPGGDPHVVASISCRVPSSDGNYTLDYAQYDSLDAMQADYDSIAAEPLEVARPDGCREDDGYTVRDAHTGSSVCIPSSTSNTIVYTYEPLDVLATLTDYFDDGIDSDAASLETYWNDEAGPNADPASIPKLLTDEQGLAAYKALRAKIPAGIRPRCKPNRNSFTNPYVGAQIECEHPSPGVWLVRYTSYLDDAGLHAAYDEDRFLALRQDETNDACPDSGTWKVKGAVRGRYACTIDVDDSYLLWTLDRDRVVAYAYAQVGDMDTAAFIDWWNNEAGPNL